MNLAIRDIRHNMGRFILTCVGLSLLLGVVLSMIGIYRGMVEDAVMLVEQPAADLWVVQGGTRGPFAESSRIQGDTREMVARIHGVQEAGSLTYQSVQTHYKNHKQRLFVVGYEPGRLGGPDTIIAGRHITQSHFEMVADRKTGFALGEAIKLGSDIFKVVGVTHHVVSSSGDPVVYIPLRDSQALQFDLTPSAVRREKARGDTFFNTPNTINAVVAKLRDRQHPQSIAKEISRWKHMTVMTNAQQKHIMLSSVVEKARKQIGMFTVLLLLVSTVILALIIHTLTMDKRREIATLKLVGAPDSTIIGLILQQALAIGMISYALGMAVVYSFADHFPRRIAVLGGDVVWLGMIVLCICLLASAAGVRMALKIDAGSALAG
jgi:putative ABC transport system permease protein